MNTQYITHGDHEFADIGFESLRAESGVGHARLVLRLLVTPRRTYSSIPPNLRPSAIFLSGWLCAIDFGRHVGDLGPVTVPWPTNQDLPSQHHITMYSTVTYQQLDLLSELRPSGDQPFPFISSIDVNVLGTAGMRSSATAQLKYDLPASEWRRLLDGIGHVRYVSIDVPVGGRAIPAAFATAATAFEKAKTHLDLHQWTDAVGACREVWDALEAVASPIEGNVGWADFGVPNTRQGWDAGQRQKALRMVARHTTHLAHHGGGAGMDEARNAVRIVGVALKYYVDRLR